MEAEVKKQFRMAEDILREIEHLVAGDLYRASISRAYYAMFHAATAAILANEVDQGPRQAIFPVFEKAFIKTGMLDKKYLNYFRQASNSRNESDSPTFGSADHRQSQTSVLRTKEFIAACRKLC